MTINYKKSITIRIDNEILLWLDKQPRTFNLSNTIRTHLHSLIDEEKGKKDENNNK